MQITHMPEVKEGLELHQIVQKISKFSFKNGKKKSHVVFRCTVDVSMWYKNQDGCWCYIHVYLILILQLIKMWRFNYHMDVTNNNT